MASLPPRVKLGPLTYRVTQDAQRIAEARSTTLEDICGQTDFTTATILLDPKLADCMKRDTLLHEVLHCLFNTAGLADEWGADKEEQTVRRLTPHLLGLLRDNPRLVAYLLE